MNERIRELAKQTGYIWHASGDPKIYEFTPEKLEKFALLIVRQCGYYADVFNAMECPVDMDPTETKPSDYIKREMGIAE